MQTEVKPVLQGNAVFLEIHRVEDYELLSCFKGAIGENEEKREQLDVFIEKWENAEKTTPEEREASLIEFLEFACSETDFITDNPQNLEEICHVLFYFLDDIDDAPSQSRKESLFEEIATCLTKTNNLPDLQLEMCSILLNLIPRCDDVATSLLDTKEQKERNRRWGNCRGRVFGIMLKFAEDNNRGELFRGRLTKKFI